MTQGEVWLAHKVPYTHILPHMRLGMFTAINQPKTMSQLLEEICVTELLTVQLQLQGCWPLEQNCGKKKNLQPWNDFARFSVFPHEEPLWVSWERSLLLRNKKGESLIQRQPNSRELFYQLQRTLDETQRRICTWARRGCHWCCLRGSWWVCGEQKELHSTSSLSSHGTGVMRLQGTGAE